jgi:hypothetical protein
VSMGCGRIEALHVVELRAWIDKKPNRPAPTRFQKSTAAKKRKHQQRRLPIRRSRYVALGCRPGSQIRPPPTAAPTSSAETRFRGRSPPKSVPARNRGERTENSAAQEN